MSDFAEAAVKAGFRHYGFSPHSPVPIDSPCNMTRDVVPEYFAEIERLRAIYSLKINFYCSMEIDYLGPDWGPSHPYSGICLSTTELGRFISSPTKAGV